MRASSQALSESWLGVYVIPVIEPTQIPQCNLPTYQVRQAISLHTGGRGQAVHHSVAHSVRTVHLALRVYHDATWDGFGAVR